MESQSAAFGKLHPSLQRVLYDMRWTSLRPIQVDTIHAVMDSTQHLIISANTAAGKTEAAFLPVLSKFADQPSNGVKALYVGPLKALINDQFRRVEDLCQRADIPVHRWHGDVGQARKSALLAKPGGVLLITPESLESLFINHPAKLVHCFRTLRFIVIDELHAFMGTERGAHLRSLLSRLTQKAAEPVRKIALSATLGDPHLTRKWLQPQNPETVRLIQGKGEQKEVRLRLHGYERPEPDMFPPDETRHDMPPAKLVSDLFGHFYGKSSLIFANSRTRLEELADAARRHCDAKRVPDKFRIHHGSLSRPVREEAEEALRSATGICTFCTTTLEMGIDVGSVECIGQLQAPHSVNALTQRLGRSGRGQGQPQVLRMYIEEEALKKDASIVSRLRPELLQAIAAVELMTQKWCEPPAVGKLHLSTLVQQVMSVLRELGGASAQTVFDRLVDSQGFPNISKAHFTQLLRSMGAHDLIEQAPQGDLILGLHGERIVNSFEFYSAFQSSEEFQVLHQGHAIGVVSSSSTLDANACIILAGRRWKIVHVSIEDKCLLVEPAAGARLPCFDGGFRAEVHAKVRETMKNILIQDNPLAYLDTVAASLLLEARSMARDLNIEGRSLFREGRSTVCLTWSSSQINRTLVALIRNAADLDVEDARIGLVVEDISPDDFIRLAGDITSSPPPASTLTKRLPVRCIEKYDHYLPDELLDIQLAADYLDLSGALAFLERIQSDHEKLRLQRQAP